MAGFDFTLDGIVQAFESLLKYVGKDWFEKKARSYMQKTISDGKSGYSHLYRPRTHPLIEWYLLFPDWKAECERIGQVFLSQEMINLALLGQSLEKVRGDKKFDKLIDRLKQLDDFYATAWEIEVAASHLVQGLNAQFIEEQATPTPDLYITDKSGKSFWVECKNRDLADDRQTQNVWHQVERQLLQYLDQWQLNYQIVLTAQEALKLGEASKIGKFITETIQQKFEPASLLRITGASATFKDDSGKFELIIHKLSEPDVQLDGDKFTLPSPREHADFGTFVCKRIDLENGRKIIANPRSIQLNYVGSVRVQNVQSAFKSAVKQLPESGPGVIHIRLPINSWATELGESRMQIENFLRKELSKDQNRRVNAVIVAIHYTELIQRGTFRYPTFKPINIVVEHDNPRTYL